MRLLYVVTEDWYFLSHRLPMARAARDAGFEVHIATRVAGGAAAITAEGFALHPVPFGRGSISPLGAMSAARALRTIHRAIEPDIVHHVALQAAVLGSLATLKRPVRAVNALTGLGFTFTSESAKAQILRPVMTAVIRFLFNRDGQFVLVQNPDDRDGMIALGIAPQRIVLIPGSGVDVNALQPMPEPVGDVAAAFVGRLLADKGVHTLIEAQKLIRARGAAVELLLAGTPAPANPASASSADLAAWHHVPGVTLLGHVDPISTVWARAHIAVLPSRREGLPKSLLEAAACGRPMVATDVPGCREVVRPGETGLLVPIDDTAALATAIATLAAAPELRQRYGEAARRLVVERFSASAIGRGVVDLYRSLAGGRTS